MLKLKNTVQNYDWGSKTALTELYNIHNPHGLPMAELWMGAHPKSSSNVVIHNEERSLRDVIDDDQVAALGKAVMERFGELPFLFKVLCASQALSIQVHPSKAAAKEGFARENAAGISLTSAERNYKDANHKPELVYALTPFQAMNGFREFHEIVSLMEPVTDVHPQIAQFLKKANAASLAELFSALLSLQDSQKTRALSILKSVAHSLNGEPWLTIRNLANDYPDDNGLFCPLLLNLISLQPGEAMFLFAETPHAYLKGVALEVMANSDNVLRAGLTSKFIDIPELLANVTFQPKPAMTLLTQPQQEGAVLHFPIPVDDFAFTIHTLSVTPQKLAQNSAALLFCVEGLAVIEKPGEQLILRPGESCFVTASESPVSTTGTGRLARVFNVLN